MELVEKLNQLRWKIEHLCADPPPRVNVSGPIAPLPPKTRPKPQRNPDDVDADICRSKCSAQWQAYTKAIMDATPAENAANDANESARVAQNKLDALLSAERGLRPDQQQARAQLNIPAARQDADAKNAAKAKAAAALKAARDKIDAALAAYIACLESCKKRAKSYRTVTYSAIGAGGTALAFGLMSGGDPAPAPNAIVQNPPVSNAPTAPVAPPTVTTPAPAPPATPVAPPNPAGSYASRTNVTFDPAQHGPVIAMDSQVVLLVNVSGQSISVSAQNNSKWIGSTGAIASDGTFNTSGSGTIVGIPNVGVTFNGRIDTSASPMRITGEYAMGTNGALPQGQPIRYGIDGQKTASAATTPR